MIALYVDDLLVTSINESALKSQKLQFSKQFKMNDFGIATFCLGIEIEHNAVSKSIAISQRLYIDKVLERFGVQDCRPVGTPMDDQMSPDELKP